MEDKFCIQNMNLYYGDFHALKDVSMNIPANEITAFIDLPAAVNPHF